MVNMKSNTDKIMEAYEKNLKKVRTAGLLAGATGIAGAVMNICNDDNIVAEDKISKIKGICIPCLKKKGE